MSIEIVEKQLKAYNERNIIAFSECFSKHIEAFEFPNTLLFRGRDALIQKYKLYFADNPNLHCEVTSRMQLDNVIIDREVVTGLKGEQVMNAVAIYIINNGLINRVFFMK